ncbi:hypothetical protein DITRI_Ditri09bG0059100 [Diplodiscus trichospermus]
MLNTDLEVDGKYPLVVEAFRRKILEADSILFASPEYNHSVTGLMKSAIDWASRPPNAWADKAAAIVSAAGLSGAKFDSDGNLIDGASKQRIKEVLLALQAYTLQLKAALPLLSRLMSELFGLSNDHWLALPVKLVK